jgi:hypothetical protein
MPLSRKHHAVSPVRRELHRSSVPTKVEPAAAHSGGQEPALALRSDGRPSGRRATALLSPRFQTFALARGQALDGREHDGIGRSSPGRFIIFDGVSHIWTS